MHTNEIYDPLEDPKDTIDPNDLPSRGRIRSILATILNRPRIVKLPRPPVERKDPGVAYVLVKNDRQKTQTEWMASTLIFNPILKYSLYRLSQRQPWVTLSQHFDEVAELYPGCRLIGGIGIMQDDEEDSYEDDMLYLIQFDNTESLDKFRLAPEYVPLHSVIPLPHAKTVEVFEDNDSAQLNGWRNLFKDTDFDDEEIVGIMGNYHDFERMEMIFLGDTRSLNNCYRSIGGKAHYAWLSHSLAKTYKEKRL